MATLASYVLAIGGLGVMIGFFGLALAHNTSYLNARLLLINLLRSNPVQAQRVCESTPHTFYEPVAMTMKACSQMGGTRDLSIIQQASKPTFDAGCSMVTEWWKGIMMKAKMAAGAAVVGSVIPFSDGKFPPIIVFLCSLLAAAAFGFVFYRQTETDRALFRSKVEVLPEVERVFVDGRYAA